MIGKPVLLVMGFVRPGSSAPVKVATTPFSFIAFETSMPLILAWAWGLLRTAAYSVCFSWMSSE